MPFIPWRSAIRILRRKRSRGQSLVELALVLPILLLLVAGALDLGRLYYSQITITKAAKEGALEASTNPTWSRPGSAGKALTAEAPRHS